MHLTVTPPARRFLGGSRVPEVGRGCRGDRRGEGHEAAAGGAGGR